IFAEPLNASNHIDEGTFSPNVGQQAEALSNTKSTSFTTTNTSSSLAFGGTYQLVNTTADTQWIEYTVPIVSSTSARSGKHLNIVGITGTDRAKFRTEMRDPSNNIIPNSSEVFDMYGTPAAQKTYVTYQNNSQSFTIPANISSIKVRLIVAGRNAS